MSAKDLSAYNRKPTFVAQTFTKQSHKSKFLVTSLSACFCSSKSKLISAYIFSFLLILLLSILATFFAAFTLKMSVRWLLHFVAFGFFFL